jgi:hypothetical protein
MVFKVLKVIQATQAQPVQTQQSPVHKAQPALTVL